MLGQSRLERFAAVAQSSCVCQCQGRQCAEYVLQANNIQAPEFCFDIYRALAYGRHESIPVVTLAGKRGGEGKSFLLAPLREIYGKEYTYRNAHREVPLHCLVLKPSGSHF